MGHERADEHVPDPHFVGPSGCEATECPRLTSECGTLQATPLEMLADGALGDADAVTGKEDGANLGSRTRRQFDAQRARLVEQFGMASDGAQVGAWIGFEAIQALLAIGA